ncbi:NAD(P)/FAD-dependent oxidoreductase [Amphiplicatus metriothermophilus]|uniref:Ferredoxin--NADP reductase n=1 Tax=Amphiplicatus metriothermophilus TaxID=1519374 RepID=A0A239PV50_9PROT|nr:NAD(P)/FAD-dependent oxidoreductase [Amphiplicatus metriothermophilus]MBB5519610.1 thioredoxin reductase (NADPH) [Amphiplicatus metriothermophilus]SNT74174.1 thioredoxin reductase (NADPH) [Amphiplicatus metriothermophilus]
MTRLKEVRSAPPGETHETDAVIIGAGPVGLFAVFELGLLGVRAHLIDILDKPGGQCVELYPEKPILDIPAIPVVTGAELTERLLQQIDPFEPVFHLNEMADSLERTDDGKWRISTDLGTTIVAPVVVIAAGGGSFTPKKPPIPGIEAFEGKSVFYAVRQREMFRERTIVIAGGGDSALDWTLNLQPIARKLTLVHRREEFRAAPDSVEKMKALAEAGAIDFHVAQITGLEGKDGVLSAVRVQSAGRGEYAISCENLLAFYGLTMKLGPIAEFGIDLAENRIAVDTEKFETSTPGIFCIGDMAHYPGKLKLILSGFHEAALMAHGAFHYVFPGRKLKFQHTTSAKDLQRKVVGSAPED